MDMGSTDYDGSIDYWCNVAQKGIKTSSEQYRGFYFVILLE